LRRQIALLLTFCLLLVVLSPARAFAAELTLEAPAQASPGQSLTLSGTVPGTEVILRIHSASGELVFFDTPAVTDGSYRISLTVPASWLGGTYRAVAVSGGAEAAKTIAIRRAGGSNGGTTPPYGPPANNGETPDAGTTSPPSGSMDPVVSPGESGVTVTLEPVASGGRLTAVLDADALAAATTALDSISAPDRQLVLRLREGEGSAYDLKLTAEAAALLWSSSAASLVIESPLGSIAYDRQSLMAVRGQGSGELRFAIETVAPSALPAAARAVTGGRPVVEVSVSVGGTTVTSFGGGQVQLGIPYELAASENPQAAVIYYLPASGEPVAVKNGRYDGNTRTVYAALSHFSMYGISVPTIAYEDVSGWATDYITYLSARSIIQGVGEDRFAPAQPVTRGEFVAMLARLADAADSNYEIGRFVDVQVGDWYAPYVQWAAESGIILGDEQGRFQPRAPISRQELAVMVDRYADAIGYTLPADRPQISFIDRAQFGEWALAAIGRLQQAGILEGLGDGRFAPRGTATRAEAAKMVAVLVQGMSR